MEFSTAEGIISPILAIIVLIVIEVFLFFYRRYKKPIFEKLRNFGIHPTIRKPPKPSDLKEDDTNNNP